MNGSAQMILHVYGGCHKRNGCGKLEVALNRIWSSSSDVNFCPIPEKKHPKVPAGALEILLDYTNDEQNLSL